MALRQVYHADSKTCLAILVPPSPLQVEESVEAWKENSVICLCLFLDSLVFSNRWDLFL